MPDDWVRDGRDDLWLSGLARMVRDRPGASLGLIWPLDQAMRYLSLPEDQRRVERQILRERFGLGESDDPSISSRRIGHPGLDRTLDDAERLLALSPDGERQREELLLTFRYQEAAQQEVRRLNALFLHDNNPVHAWMAFAISDMYSLDIPAWLMRYLRHFANTILEILMFEARNGKPVKRQAERIGKALGFGRGGKGKSDFRGAAKPNRDFCAFREVSNLMEAGEKKIRAYEIVADERGVTRSTIQKAYNRHKLRHKQDK